ncbi:MAG: hypothetical protein LDL11_08735 [Desulfarculus sp.]|nr:hypothetical protein [Desulfarculus sp.]
MVNEQKMHPRHAAEQFGVNVGTVHKWLRRSAHVAPGDMVHSDIKELGRIAGVGHRTTGDRFDSDN